MIEKLKRVFEENTELKSAFYFISFLSSSFVNLLSMRNPEITEDTYQHFVLDEKSFQNLKPQLEKQKIYFEIGSGNGKFLTELADSLKDGYFFGCEIDLKRIKKTIKRIENFNLPTTYLHRGRGEVFLNWFDDESLEHFYINFPDPWPKKKHYRRRFFYPLENLELVIRKLKKGGRLYFVSDHEEYFFFALNERLLKHSNLTTPFLQGFVYSLEGYFSTLYEEKFKKIGKAIHYTYFVKN
ncbi:MAG TPA: hypothetical protein DHW82_02950 [Spirochaetia bacterium]|nr:MAG: hypothetical protein A2Y41_00665 [Spirochaetes bacterium GWB1_36_13]HCL55949.1 hypothetical protein [Spirochaetia bacterium]